MKPLLIKCYDREYKLDTWNIKYDIDRMRIIISGMDLNAMYFQMKVKRIYTRLESEATIKIEV